MPVELLSDFQMPLNSRSMIERLLFSFLFTRFILIKNIKYTVIAFYIILLPIYAIGILMGTFLDPVSNASTIMILFCTLTVFITDKPQRILGYLAGIAVAFAVCSYLSKPLDLFIGDMVNLFIYSAIGVGVNMLTLSDRVNSAENYTLMCDRADQDTLTSLLNRGAGERNVIKMLESGQLGSFIMIDIDDYKHFNDMYGHVVGDEVICEVSAQLKEGFRDSDIIFRMGGDEFAVFAVGLLDKGACEERMNRVQHNLHSIQTSYPEPLDVSISMGCTICRSTAYKFDQLYKLSDDALYAAKKTGKNGFFIQEQP